MTRIRSHAIWSIGTLLLAAGLLTGCPKRPEVQTAKVPPPGATDSAGPTGVGGADAGSAMGGATIGGAAGMAQPGGDAASAASQGAGGTAGQAGAGGQGAGAAGAGPGAGAGGPAAGAGGGTSGTGQTGTGAGTTAGTGSGSSSTDSGSTAAATGLPAGPPSGTTLPLLPSPAEFVEAKELGDVHFEFDKADLRPGDRTVLDGNAAWLRANAKAQLLVEGHCDERGTNEYNLALGERRAKATREYLASVGVDTARVTVISYGKERPVCNDASESCWGKNRRAHFLVKQ